MPTLDMDNYEEEQHEYINLVNSIEEKLIQWLDKGSIYEIEMKVLEINGEIHERLVRIYALDTQRAIEKAKILGKTIPLIRSPDSEIGLIFPKTPSNTMRSNTKRKGKRGLVGKYADAAKDKAKNATFQDGVPRPLSLTKAHINSMLESKTFQTIDESELEPQYVRKFATRCLFVILMWLAVGAIGLAVFFAGLHPKHSETALLGLLNPFTVFGVIALATSALESIHACYSRRNAFNWLKDRGE